MSWFGRSFVNSLKGEEDDENDEEDHKKSPTDQQQEEDEDPTRRVKEDLSELTKTLTRQLWGVASFLAPPPSVQGRRSDPTVDDQSEGGSSPRLAGIRSDLAEIGGRFKNGISILSNTKAVSEISKIASNFLTFGLEEDEEENYEGGGVGISEEIVAFARNVSMHPETWLDFPSIPDEFNMSDAQHDHALAVERLAPNLASLRIELCPSHMSEGRFWKIYFVLLHSRLNRQDADLLTTPQIAEARTLLLQDLPNRRKLSSEGVDRVAAPPSKEVVASIPSEENVLSSSDTCTMTLSTNTPMYDDEPSASIPITDVETEKHPVQSTEVKIIDKSVIEEDPPAVQAESDNTISIQKYEEDVDDWLEDEEEQETDEATSISKVIPLGNEEDVSFSDLEDEDDDDQGTAKPPKP